LAALTVFAPIAASVVADNYPSHPIHLLVPFPPGGAPDMLARAVGAQLTMLWGQTVVVENKAGAGGNIATEAVARAAPDGYTCLMSSSSGLSLNPHLYKNLPYDVERDLAPVSQVASSQLVLIANPEFKAHSMQDVIRLAKENPGAINYASVGIGTVHHVAMELIQRSTGIKMTHVPYKGNTPALVDLTSGQVSLMLTSVQEAQQSAKSGKVRILAVTGATRVPSMPDVPTIAESGVPGFDVSVWYGVVCPAHTPEAILDKLSSGIAQGLKDPKLLEQLESRELSAIGNTPAEFTSVIETQSARWAKVIDAAHIQLD
jgi:tripartite-type tricarboxylate transporter receptor subunit TctC